jgi:hypothetical protein
MMVIAIVNPSRKKGPPKETYKKRKKKKKRCPTKKFLSFIITS